MIVRDERRLSGGFQGQPGQVLGHQTDVLEGQRAICIVLITRTDLVQLWRRVPLLRDLLCCLAQDGFHRCQEIWHIEGLIE